MHKNRNGLLIGESKQVKSGAEGTIHSQEKAPSARRRGVASDGVDGPPATNLGEIVTILALLAGCGGASASGAPAVELEPLRIQQHRDGSTTAYDAQTLFGRGLEHLNQGRCRAAVALYDQLADEFPDSRFRSPGLYNAGFCLHESGELEAAAVRLSRLLQEGGTSDDERHGAFLLAKVHLDQEQYQALREVSEALLQRDDLSADERAEAMARRAQGYLGDQLLDEAERTAREVLLYSRTRPDDDPLRDNTYVAAAAFVLAESFRLRSQRIEVLPGALETQREQLEERAQYLLSAQRAYFDTIGHGHPHWSSAAGFQIGAMYQEFWQALMEAPAPASEHPLTPQERQVYEEEYRERLRELARPLLRHAVRYWELTLMMVERTRSRGPWSDRIREGLETVRAQLDMAPNGDPGKE